MTSTRAGAAPAAAPTEVLAAPRHLGVLAESGLVRQGGTECLFFEGRWYRGSDLLDRARRVTGGLVELGVRPGERVVLLMANGPDVAVTYTAVWRAGAVVTPVVFLLTVPELRHVLTDSAAAAVVTTPELLAKVAEAAQGVSTLRHVVVVGDVPARMDGPTLTPYAELAAAEPHDVVGRDEDDLGALMYTGGTTGRSKGVMLSHGNLWWCGWCSYEKGRVVNTTTTSLVPLPLSHAYGMIVTVVGAFREEPVRTTLMRWFDPTGWLTLAAEHRIESAPVVPSMLAMLLQQPLEDYDLSALRYLPIGSAPLSPRLLEEWERRVPGSVLLNGYGCTESGSVISSSLPDARRSGSVGTPIVGYEVRVLDDAGADVPAGADGEICVQGPGVMQGYWNAPEATAVALEDGWLHTGDVGHVDADGYLTLVDRKKDLIIRGGFNVFPRDVEDALLTHPAVAMAAVVGRPDPLRGEEVVAFVSLRPGAAATPDELVEHTKGRLAATKYPREVHVVDAVPLTSVGKTDRKALRARLLLPPAASGT